MIHLNELPACLLVEIFSYLHPSEVIRLKLVCKAWQEISCYVRLKSLSVFHWDPKVDQDKYYLRFLKQYKSFDLYVSDFEKFIKSTQSLLQPLKRLVCFFAEPVDHGSGRIQDFLNRFRRLEELQINVFPHGESKHPIQFILEFERLRKLFIHCERGETFELNCPELSYLDVKYLSDCRISCPEKLRTLVLQTPFEDGQIKKSVNDLIEKCVNLKNLIVTLWVNDPNKIPRTFFKRLPKSLQKLIFFEYIMFYYRFSSEYDLEDCFRAQYSIDEEDSSGLRVFYLGVEVGLSRFISPEDEPLPKRIQDKNFPNFLVPNLANSVDSNVFLDYIDYNAFDRLLPDFNPLYEKIYSVHPNCRISLTKMVTDQARLLEFIQKARPRELSLCYGTSFSWPFFDSLTEICSSYIKEIYFYATGLGSEPGALDFLFKMTELEEITIKDSQLDIIPSLELVIAAYEKIKSLECFEFDEWFSIWPTINLTLTYYVSSKKAVEKQRKHFCIYLDDGLDGLAALRGMVARLKERRARREPNIIPEKNNSMDFNKLISMIKKMKKEQDLKYNLKYKSFLPKFVYKTLRFVRRLKD